MGSCDNICPNGPDFETAIEGFHSRSCLLCCQQPPSTVFGVFSRPLWPKRYTALWLDYVVASILSHFYFSMYVSFGAKFTLSVHTSDQEVEINSMTCVLSMSKLHQSLFKRSTLFQVSFATWPYFLSTLTFAQVALPTLLPQNYVSSSTGLRQLLLFALPSIDNPQRNFASKTPRWRQRKTQPLPRSPRLAPRSPKLASGAPTRTCASCGNATIAWKPTRWTLRLILINDAH